MFSMTSLEDAGGDPVEEMEGVVARVASRTKGILHPTVAVEGLRLVEMPEKEPAESHGPWFKADEYDAIRGTMERGVTRVRERSWRPVRESNETAQLALVPAPRSELLEHHRSEDAEVLYRSLGMKPNLDRLHGYVTSMQAGRVADDRVFEHSVGVPRVGVFSFVVDLSASMKGSRVSGRDSPIYRAVQLILRWASGLEASGFRVGVFGVDDFGRRSVTLRRVVDWTEPLDVSRIASLHTTHYGGARMGVAIRLLSNRASRRMGALPHVVCVLSDTGSRYVTRGIDWLLAAHLDREHCWKCTSPTCHVEPNTPDMRVRPHSDMATWYPTAYEYADMSSAFRADRSMIPMLILLDDVFEPARVRDYVPTGLVDAFLTGGDLGRLDGELRNLVNRATRR